MKQFIGPAFWRSIENVFEVKNFNGPLWKFLKSFPLIKETSKPHLVNISINLIQSPGHNHDDDDLILFIALENYFQWTLFSDFLCSSCNEQKVLSDKTSERFSKALEVVNDLILLYSSVGYGYYTGNFFLSQSLNVSVRQLKKKYLSELIYYEHNLVYMKKFISGLNVSLRKGKKNC